MKKASFRFMIGIFTGIVILTSCVPSYGLEGTGGEGEEEPAPPEPPPPTEEALIPQSPHKSINFITPEVVIVIPPDGSGYTTEISSPPMGKAEFQLTAPEKMVLEREYLIELIIVPEKINVNKDKVLVDSGLGSLQAFQGTLDIYPIMNAELIAGETLSIKTISSSDQIISSEKASVWMWFIKTHQDGIQNIAISISVVVKINNTPDKFELVHQPINIEVVTPTSTPPPPTPTFTPSPIPPPSPTNTPIPSIAEQLSGSATQVSIALISAVATVVAAVIVASKQRDKSARKKKASQAELEKKKIEEDEKNFKDNLPNNEKMRRFKDQVEKSKKGKQK